MTTKHRTVGLKAQTTVATSQIDTLDGHARGSMSRVLEYAASRPGVLLHLAEITHATGLTERQAQQAINNARRAVTVEGKALGMFDTQIRGRAWVYTPHAAPGEPAPQAPAAASDATDAPLFEQIGRAKDGTLVLQGEDGGLYLARAVA